jgi:hypothetical protein
VQFDYAGTDRYDRLARVFNQSVAMHYPEAKLHMIRIPPPREVKKNSGMTSNWYKFKAWSQFLDMRQDGDRVIFMDADLLVVRSLHDAFERDFDVALTKRTNANWPYNGGVVFINVNQATREFVRMWGEIDDQMYNDSAFHEPYKRHYRGQNQASLGWMVEHDAGKTHIVELPCAEWNACNEDWMRFDRKTTRVVHIKSNLRRAVLGELPNWPSKLKPICKLWAAVETAAKGGS